MPLTLCSLLILGATLCDEPTPTPDAVIQTVFVIRHEPERFDTALLIEQALDEIDRVEENDLVVDGYVARLGRADRFNSLGVELTNAAAIVRQDRYNVHAGAHVDEDDEIDSTFDTPERRKDLEAAVREIDNFDEIQAAVDEGEPLVDVTIGIDSIEVFVVDETTDPQVAIRNSGPQTAERFAGDADVLSVNGRSSGAEEVTKVDTPEPRQR